MSWNNKIDTQELLHIKSKKAMIMTKHTNMHNYSKQIMEKTCQTCMHKQVKKNTKKLNSKKLKTNVNIEEKE